MTRMINRNQGVLALVSFLATFALIIVWVTTVKADIQSIREIQAEEIVILRQIAKSLNEQSWEHRDFKKYTEKTNEILLKMSEAIIKLDGTLKALEIKLDTLKPKPYYQEYKDE